MTKIASLMSGCVCVYGPGDLVSLIDLIGYLSTRQ